MKAFYGAKLSPHMTESPEGFLICHGVPICRTGTQKYLKREIGEKGNDLVDVNREEDEVFKPAAMASFEGKPVTDDHPAKEVDPHNFGSYIKGSVQNVRRGTGEDKEHVVCDLVIYDAGLIQKIKHGKREISCGYDCEYIDNGDGTYRQANIIGNHVAVVDNGRAGKSIAIKDSKPKGGRKMSKKSIFARMFEAFAKDAEPDEVLEAAKAVDAAECGDSEGEAPKPQQEKPTYDAETMEMVMDAIHELNEQIQELKASKTQDEEPEEEKLTGLDAVEAAIKKRMASKDNDMGEEEVEADPEDLNTEDEDPEDDPEESEVVEVEESEDEDPEEAEKKAAQDSAMSLAMLRAIKPIVASMPPKQRQQATDVLTRAVKKSMAKPTQPLPGGYGALLKRKATKDAASKQNLRAFGEACRKRNPHNKDKK